MNCKKIIALILTVMLLVSCMPTGLADTGTVAEGTCGDSLTWVLDSEGTLTISGTGAMTNYSSGTDAPWYDYCDKISTVIIEQGVTTISDYAIYSCDSLTSVTIPDSVTEIGYMAFASCSGLTSIEVDINNQYYTSLDGNLYTLYMKNLIQYAIGKEDTTFTIPDSVITIGDRAFQNCNGLTSVIIPDSVRTIGVGSFFGCDSLTNVTIPDSVTTIGYVGFYGCYSLSDVYYFGTEEQWNEITIDSYNEYLINATIHFEEKQAVLENIEVTTLPTKTEYFVSEELDLTGMVVNAVYDDGNYIEITDYTVSGFDSITAGEQTITVAYDEFTAEFQVTVKPIEDKYLNIINNWTTPSEVDALLNEMANDEYIINQYNDFVYYFKKYDSLSKREIVCQELIGRQYSSVDEFINYFIKMVELYEEAETPTVSPGGSGGGGGGGYVPSLPDEDEFEIFTIGMSAVKGRASDGVRVPVYIMENPGIAGIQLSVDYDDELTLAGICQSVGEENSALETLEITLPGDMNVNPLTILMDGMEADSTNGYFVYLDFIIPEGAEDGTVYDIKVSAANSYAFDNDLNSVEFNVMDGSITVQNYTIGDINDDGIINIKDVTLLRRGVAGGYGVTLNKAADVNVDGITNVVDITLLRRYIAGGYGVVLDN